MAEGVSLSQNRGPLVAGFEGQGPPPLQNGSRF